jgi:hypothetical protein
MQATIIGGPMQHLALTVLLICAPIAVPAADDLRISQLEQDVRNLQRELRAISQQLDELNRQLSRPGDPLRPPSASAVSPITGPWLDASRWQQIKVGMSELEVITLLGPPVSMRAVDSERVLLYAMEIGSTGFLNGSVTLRDRKVALVKQPVLQ